MRDVLLPNSHAIPHIQDDNVRDTKLGGKHEKEDASSTVLSVARYKVNHSSLF